MSFPGGFPGGRSNGPRSGSNGSNPPSLGVEPLPGVLPLLKSPKPTPLKSPLPKVSKSPGEKLSKSPKPKESKSPTPKSSAREKNGTAATTSIARVANNAMFHVRAFMLHLG